MKDNRGGFRFQDNPRSPGRPQQRHGTPTDYRARSSPPQTTLPSNYLQHGYFDSKGNLFPEMLQGYSEQLARQFKRQGLTSTQLRRFFNRARSLERQLDAKTRDFGRLKEDIEMLKPLAAASVGRKTAPDIFKDFIDKNVQLVLSSDNPEVFKRGFIMHFQSVVAYLKYYEEKDKGGYR